MIPAIADRGGVGGKNTGPLSPVHEPPTNLAAFETPRPPTGTERLARADALVDDYRIQAAAALNANEAHRLDALYGRSPSLVHDLPRVQDDNAARRAILEHADSAQWAGGSKPDMFHVEHPEPEPPAVDDYTDPADPRDTWLDEVRR